MLVQFARLISTWIAAAQCLATVEAGKPNRAIVSSFTPFASMEITKFPGIEVEEDGNVFFQKRFVWGSIVD